LLLLTIGFGALAAYSFFTNKKQVQSETSTPVRTADSTFLTNNSNVNTVPETEQSTTVLLDDEKEPETTESIPENNSTEEPDKQVNSELKEANPKEATPKEATPKEVNSIKKEEQKQDERETEKVERKNEDGKIGEYKVISKAYFHNQPDEATRRDAYILHWNNAVLKPSQEKNGFVYIVFTNDQGQTSKGWLRKKDLVEVNQ
jgi:serine/threonine-protein kinase